MNTYFSPVWMVSWTVFGKRNAILCPTQESAQKEYDDISTFEHITNCLVQKLDYIDFYKMVEK